MENKYFEISELMRNYVKDFLNNENKEREMQNFFELSYCKVCGNYDLDENHYETLDGTIYCSYCEHSVVPENIVRPNKKEVK